MNYHGMKLNLFPKGELQSTTGDLNDAFNETSQFEYSVGINCQWS